MKRAHVAPIPRPFFSLNLTHAPAIASAPPAHASDGLLRFSRLRATLVQSLPVRVDLYPSSRLLVEAAGRNEGCATFRRGGSPPLLVTDEVTVHSARGRPPPTSIHVGRPAAFTERVACKARPSRALGDGTVAALAVAAVDENIWRRAIDQEYAHGRLARPPFWRGYVRVPVSRRPRIVAFSIGVQGVVYKPRQRALVVQW